MHFVLSILGIVAAFLLIVNREMIGDMLGEAEWMQTVGGVYYIVVYIGIFIFFWSLAELTGTTEILLKPLTWLIPGGKNWSNEVQVDSF
jgi:uncharacterized membrane protein